MPDLGRIMSAGDSITRGWSSFASGTQGTYRRWLTQTLDAANVSYTMVGPHNSHPSGDYLDQGQWQHECFAVGGFGTEDFLDDAVPGRAIEDRVEEYDPDLVLLYIGINDLHKDVDQESVVDDIEEIIFRARGEKPSVDFIVALIAPRISTATSNASPAGVAIFNTLLASRCGALDTEISRVLTADCETGWSDALLSDNVHPNEDGDKHISEAFVMAIEGLTGTLPDLGDWSEFAMSASPGGVAWGEWSSYAEGWSSKLFGVPGGFSAELIDDTSVALSWSPIGRATSYRLQREVLNGSWQHDAFLTTTETSLLDTISAGGQYRYRIQSIRTVD